MSVALEYLDEVVLDLKVFFGVDDPDEELSAKQFFTMAINLPAYRGAVRNRIEIYVNEHKEELEQMEKDKKRLRAHPTPLPAFITREQLAAHPKTGSAPGAGQMAPLFDMAQVSADA